MARHKNVNWNLPEGTPTGRGTERTHIWESIQTALLMDIRDELKELNAILHCSRFLDIPFKLDAIKKHTEVLWQKHKRPSPRRRLKTAA